MIRLALTLALAAFAQEGQLTPEEKKKLMDQHYEKAFGYYSKKEFGRAVEHYNNVLKLDPDQQSARKMMNDAREKLSEQNKKGEDRLKKEARDGDFRGAFDVLQTLLDNDPSNERYLSMQHRLEKVVPIMPRVRGTSKGRAMTRTGVSAYVGAEGTPDPKLAYNALRYAAELEPDDNATPKLVTLVENAYPDLASSDRVPEGVSFLDYKRKATLDLIYEGKYPQAIRACEEVLAMDPEDVPTLKRAGSAYFQLGKKKSARAIWQKALTLAPTDKQLQKYLGKTGTD